MKNGEENLLPSIDVEISISLFGTSTRGRNRIAAQDFLFHLHAISESAPALKTVVGTVSADCERGIEGSHTQNISVAIFLQQQPQSRRC